MASVIRSLGKGGHGIVEEVKLDGQRYARKTYKEFLSGSVVREVALLSSVEHPNIVQCKKVVLDTRPQQIYLELADESLYTYSCKGTSLDKVAQVIHGILCGLKALHDQGLIHGDLTPMNILMNDGIPQLADFGGTTYHDANLRAVNVAWESPESLVLGENDRSGDMWALGIIIYEWLSVKEPWDIRIPRFQLLKAQLEFRGCPPSGKVRDRLSPSQILHHPPKRVSPFTSREYVEINDLQLWDDLINGCLEMDPSSRWNVEQALNSPLFEGLDVPTAKWNFSTSHNLLLHLADGYPEDHEVYNAAKYLTDSLAGRYTRSCDLEIAARIFEQHQYRLHSAKKQ